ncbi:hypothetical protein SDC9_136006 [bioreactor metagenome]|uniref:Uncharacterized protein n=1 Tax=bioreactor metagenome TaxID=1076179 RepID=A0A645DK02_9ZZZZ
MDHSNRKLLLGKLPGGQTRALQPGAGFGHIDHAQLARPGSTADYGQRRAHAAGGQGACAAKGEHVGARRDQLRADPADGAVGDDLLAVYRDRLGIEGQKQVGRLEILIQAILHPGHGAAKPATGFGSLQLLSGLYHAPGEVRQLGQLGGRQTIAVSRRNGNRGRALYHPVGNGLGHLPVISALQPYLLRGQLSLIQQRKGVALPLHCVHTTILQNSSIILNCIIAYPALGVNSL